MGEIVQDKEEETLSLCNLTLSTDDTEHDNKDFSFTSSEPPTATDNFEFFSEDLNINKEISYAEDIIFCGKLIPFKDQVHEPPPPLPPTQQQTHHHHNPPTSNHKPQTFHRRRSESLSELKSSRSNTTSKTKLAMRTSRSLDYQKLHRNSSSSSDTFDIHRNSSVRSSGRHDVSGAKLLKSSRWCLLTFGLVKFPPEMDIHDIKNRQVRRNIPGTMFPASDAVEKSTVNRRSYWGLLRVLSCKDHASVAVTTTSFGCMPQQHYPSRVKSRETDILLSCQDCT